MLLVLSGDEKSRLLFSRKISHWFDSAPFIYPLEQWAFGVAPRKLVCFPQRTCCFPALSWNLSSFCVVAGPGKQSLCASCFMQFCTYILGIRAWTQKCWQMEEGVGLLSHRITEYAQFEGTHKDH